LPEDATSSQRGDVGVGEARERVGLLVEAGAGALVGEGAFGEDLEGDVAVELLVVGAVDLTHASRPEALDDAVVGERAADHPAPLRPNGMKLGERAAWACDARGIRRDELLAWGMVRCVVRTTSLRRKPRVAWE